MGGADTSWDLSPPKALSPESALTSSSWGHLLAGIVQPSGSEWVGHRF